MHPKRRLLRFLLIVILWAISALPAAAVQYQITRITNNNFNDYFYRLSATFPKKGTNLNTAGQLVWIEEVIDSILHNSVILYCDSNGNIQPIASYPISPGSEIVQLSINDKGQIAWALRNNYDNAIQIYLKDQNKPEQLITQFIFNVNPDGFYFKLNNLGQIIWIEANATTKFNNNGVNVTIAHNVLGPTVDINNKGKIAWCSIGQDQINLYYNGATSQIATGNITKGGLKINDQGQIILSQWNFTIGGHEIFLYDPKSGYTPKQISTAVPSGFLVSYQMNNNGQIIWTYSIPSAVPEIYLYDPESNTNPQAISQGHSTFDEVQINDFGQIIWSSVSSTSPPTFDLYLSTPGNRNNPQKIATLFLSAQYCINNSGQIGCAGAGNTNPGNQEEIYLATPQVEAAKKIYGLFVGVEQDEPNKDMDLRGDLAAKMVFEKFSNVPNFAKKVLLTANIAKGGLKRSDIEEAVNVIKKDIRPGDAFIFFINAHGGFIPLVNTWLSIGTSVVSNILPDIPNPNDFLTDNDLYNILNGMDNVQKYVLIDSCYSGGFAGAVNKLKNASLIASSTSYQKSHTYAEPGSRNAIGLFGFALSDGFSKKDNGKLKVDGNNDGDITPNEIFCYIAYWNGLTGFLNTVVYEEDLGDPVGLTRDMWNPTAVKTSDFNGCLSTAPKIIPALYLLLLN